MHPQLLELSARLIDWPRMIEEIDRALTQAAQAAAGRAAPEAVDIAAVKPGLEPRIAQTEALLKGFDDCLKLVEYRVGQCDLALAKKEKAVAEWLSSVRAIRESLSAWPGP
jgi:hypothetical protein